MLSRGSNLRCSFCSVGYVSGGIYVLKFNTMDLDVCAGNYE
jgi:hypothetical protein